MPSSPGSSNVARAASPGTPSAATSRSRSIAWLSNWRNSGLSSGPPDLVGTNPNNPDAGSKRRLLRGSLTRFVRGKSAKVPPSTRSAFAAANDWIAPAESAPPSSSSCRVVVFFVRRDDLAHQLDLAAGARRRGGEGPGAVAVAQDRHLRLREQRQQSGPRRAQRDLDDPVGHRHHVDDGAECILEAVLASAAKLALHQPGDVLGVDLASVGPVGRREAEDVAQAVVADCPALGEAADDVARCVEADEALGDVLEQHLVRKQERPRAGSRSFGSPPITTTLSVPSRSSRQEPAVKVSAANSTNAAIRRIAAVYPQATIQQASGYIARAVLRD